MEMKARGAHIIAVIEEGDEEIKSLADDYIEVPKGIPSVLSPIPFAVPLQLLSVLCVRLRKGLQPRHAKKLGESAVTVK